MASIHPSNVFETIQNFANPQSFSADLKTAFAAASSTGRRPYRHVFVLLTAWEHEYKKETVHGDLHGLEKVFSEDYGFTCKTYLIPTRLISPKKCLRDEIDKFKELWEDKENLLIFYYAGRACRPSLAWDGFEIE